MIILRGSVSEWFKEHAWKACVGATLPQVRILSLPPKMEKPELALGFAFLKGALDPYPVASAIFCADKKGREFHDLLFFAFFSSPGRVSK